MIGFPGIRISTSRLLGSHQLLPSSRVMVVFGSSPQDRFILLWTAEHLILPLQAPVSCLWNRGDRSRVSFIGGDRDEKHSHASNSLEIPIACRSSLSLSFFKVHTLRMVRDSKEVCRGHLVWMICRTRLIDGKVILENLVSGDFPQQVVTAVRLSHTKKIYSPGGKRWSVPWEDEKLPTENKGWLWGDGVFGESIL